VPETIRELVKNADDTGGHRRQPRVQFWARKYSVRQLSVKALGKLAKYGKNNHIGNDAQTHCIMKVSNDEKSAQILIAMIVEKLHDEDRGMRAASVQAFIDSLKNGK
jgi:hypothetical protein